MNLTKREVTAVKRAVNNVRFLRRDKDFNKTFIAWGIIKNGKLHL